MVRRIEYELFLNGHIVDGFTLTTKEALELIFRFNRTYEDIKDYCIRTHLGCDVEDFLSGDNVSLKYISEYTLEHISKYQHANICTIGIWRGIRPSNYAVDVWNSDTIRIVRDKWPDIIQNLHKYNKKIVKLCANIIPYSKMEQMDPYTNSDGWNMMLTYWLNRKTIDVIPKSFLLTMDDGILLHRLWREQPNNRKTILSVLHSGIHSYHVLHYSIIELLCKEYNMDKYIIKYKIYQCLYLLRDWNIGSIEYEPNMYIECKKLGKDVEFYCSISQLSLPCSLCHVVNVSCNYIDDLETFMRLLDKYYNIIRLYNVRIDKKEYPLFHQIHHKYHNASKILLSRDIGLKLYTTYNIQGSTTLYDLKKIQLEVLDVRKNTSRYNDIDIITY